MSVYSSGRQNSSIRLIDGELPEDEDIQDASECLIKGIPYAGIGMTTTD